MERERLAANLLEFIPSIFKRLVKSFPSSNISRQQMELLFTVGNQDNRPMSYYSEKLMMSRPNLTVLTDKLIEEGLIERAFDPHDRRVIILNITAKGREFLNQHREVLRQEMLNRLNQFDDSDIKRLNELIEEMRDIFDKFDHVKQP